MLLLKSPFDFINALHSLGFWLRFLCHETARQNNVKPPEKFIFICSLDNFYYNFPGGISHCLLYFILVICFVEATNGFDSLSLIATFTFVARDSNTGKSAPVNQVLPESEQEKILWEEAKESNKLRKKKRVERKKAFENEDSDRLNALSLKFLPSPNLIAL